MKKVLIIAIVLMAISTSAFAQNLVEQGDFSSPFRDAWVHSFSAETGGGSTWSSYYGFLSMTPTSGPLGVYQIVDTIPGMTYEINAQWRGSGANTLAQILFFNTSTTDYGTLNSQVLTPNAGMVVAQIDYLNDPTVRSYPGGGEWDSIANYLTGPTGNRVTATGNQMVVGMVFRTTNFGTLNVDNVSAAMVNPEPSSMLALFGGLASMAGMVIKRRRK